MSHVDHFRPITDYLFSDVDEIWRRSEGGDRPPMRDRLVITAEVHELRQMNTVSSSPVLVEEEETVIKLYHNTSDKGHCSHYQWILASAVPAEFGDHEFSEDEVGEAAPVVQKKRPREAGSSVSDEMRGSCVGAQVSSSQTKNAPKTSRSVPDGMPASGVEARPLLLQKGSASKAGRGPNGMRANGVEARVDDEIEDDELEEENPETVTLSTWLVSSRALKKKTFLTEQDQDQEAARRLSRALRDRPTLPPTLNGETDLPFLDVASGMKMPSAHCAFRGCMWSSDRRDDVKDHVCSQHGARIMEECGPRAQNYVYDFYCEAIAVRERATVPVIGFSVDRRSIDQTNEVYNDASIKQLSCLVCAQSKTCVPHTNSLIEYKPAIWLRNLSSKSLRLNLDFAHFHTRYATSGPLAGAQGLQGWEWRRVLHLPGRKPLEILCCPEDIYCNTEHEPHIVCPKCQVPLCRDCRITMASPDPTCAVPMALANDNWYDYAPELIYKWKVRFIEAAAAAPVWTTMIVYYIEEDQGHLLNEHLQQPQYRTAARGNATSYHMPWEDILKSLSKVCADPELSMLPHDEDTLARLVGFQLRSNSTDVAKFFKQAQLRAHVVLKLLYLLIERDHPSFRGKGSAENLRKRMREAVAARYPDTEEAHLPESERQGIIPPAVLKEIELAHVASKKSPSLVYEKAATPAERSELVGVLEETIRPNAIVEERHSDTTLDCNVAHARAFEDFGTLKVQTGSKFVDQWKPECISQALPFTFSRAVGGAEYDDSSRTRRRFEDSPQVSSSEFTRGICLRVESQFRCDWSCLVLLRNLHFRWSVLRSKKLFNNLDVFAGKPAEDVANQYIVAVQDLYKMLRNGTYKHQSGRQLPLKGDVCKLLHAEGVTPLQKQLLRNLQFVGAGISGVQGTRQHIGRCMTGGPVFYGLPLFLTLSPNERYSSLALRLSRYRVNDPLVRNYQGVDAPSLRRCAGKDYPSLCTPPSARCRDPDDVVIDLPMYDIRRALLAKDPVCIVHAFHTYIRFVLARLLGIRMCPLCPRCNARGSANPCQDRFGSNATPLGGILGRCDALAGVVEHQGQGTPHIHAVVHVQRLHQKRTLREIADFIQQDASHVAYLKQFQSWACREEHFIKEQHDAEIEAIEKEWPSYKKASSNKLCVLPAFLASDAFQDVWSLRNKLGKHRMLESKLAQCFANAQQDAGKWRQNYSKHVQTIFSLVQHHMHKVDPKTLRRIPLNSCRKKGAKKDVCKHDFPKLHQLSGTVKVVCKGVARHHHLPLRGRRGALGSFLGKRDDQWHSGTSPALAAFFQSNSNIIVNDRLPITAETHCEDCPLPCVASHKISDAIVETQRAQTMMAGYVTGHLSLLLHAFAFPNKKPIATMYGPEVLILSKIIPFNLHISCIIFGELFLGINS